MSEENTENIDLSCYGRPREQVPEGEYCYVYIENIEKYIERKGKHRKEKDK